MEDGSVVIVEIAAGRLTRVKPDGKTQTVARPGGGPNGLAVGPDGAFYVCNNGGSFTYTTRQGLTIPGHAPKDHAGGASNVPTSPVAKSRCCTIPARASD